MLLMTGNTRSGGVGQGRASFARRASGRSALTDDGAEGTRPPTLKRCVLLWFPFRNGKVAAQQPKSPVFPLAA
jgi:hypothetical protein